MNFQELYHTACPQKRNPASERGQSHLNSDVTIAHEGRPQGAPLPIVFFLAKKSASSRLRRMEFAIAHYDLRSSRRFALGRAPTRGAPTDCLLAAFCPGKGTHKGCPYRLSALGVWPWGGHLQGVPLPIVCSRCLALGRAPTRGAPTDCLLAAFCPGKGTHKGCPYRLSALGVWPWGGHLQGVPLPIVCSRCLALGRAPTRGAPTDCLLAAFCPGKGTHKGCPYRLSALGVWPWGGHLQGVPLPIVCSRCLALGRAPTRGAPTDCLLAAFCPGEGTHKGRPYPIQAASRDFSNLMGLPWHPNDSALGLGGFSVFGFSFLVTPLVRGGSLKLCFWVSKACQQLSGMGGCLDWCSPERWGFLGGCKRRL